MRPHFDIEALRTMVVGTELGSFARAAVQLGRSQSAVSMQLKRLEEQAGHILFQRNGRGLVPTEAGETLLAYARRIVDMHDEAGATLGATVAAPAIRLGLPQDFFEDVMPDAIAHFSKLQPNVHVEVRAGRNYALEEEVRAGRLDIALAFSEAGRSRAGDLLASMPMFWFGREDAAEVVRGYQDGLPLVLFNHPCLFRQAALQALDAAAVRWRLSLTTPSLSGLWAAVRFGLGVTVRTMHGIPDGIRRLDSALPRLPALELRILTGADISPAASEFVSVLETVTRKRLIAKS
ncbi:LysR family transcriptional regulator [Paraburkholderia sp. GAS82]|uniref:LysR family transcriptional regulator n=1 Tax=Paraburkholderia sp. GAS82 TaxID=3035137 RepID=UPI003D1EF87B